VRAPRPQIGDLRLADPLDASVGGLAGRLARLLFGSAFSRAAVSVTVRVRPTTPSMRKVSMHDCYESGLILCAIVTTRFILSGEGMLKAGRKLVSGMALKWH
jgi:hypothetical protein